MLQASGNPFVIDRGSSFNDQTWAAGWGVINTLPHQFSPSHSPSRCFFIIYLLAGQWGLPAQQEVRPRSPGARGLPHRLRRTGGPQVARNAARVESVRFCFVSGDGDNGSGKFVLIAVRRRRDGAFLPASDRQEVSIAPKLCLNFCSRKPRRKFLECVPCTPPHKA